MVVRIGVNGCGRVGRPFVRIVLGRGDLELAAVNDVTDPSTLAYLLKYDTNYGPYPGEVKAEDDTLVMDGRRVKVLSERDPAKLRWGDLGVDVVVESTGVFTDAARASLHIQPGGARKVIIAAPAKGEDLTMVMGVNEGDYDPTRHHVVSNASCTTNCLALVAKVLEEAFGIEYGLMTTVHAYTNDQRILDQPHDDLRRARAAAMNIIPTKTGAARAVSLVLPKLKLSGLAMRVPVSAVSVVDLVAVLRKPVTAGDVNDVFMRAAGGPLGRYLDITFEPLVSVDFKGTSKSAIVDGLSTMVIGDRMVKVVAWYDNEWGYAERLADAAALVGGKGT